jgi:NAD(P)-dependent dehydrogenase (short-subunit alcohol dehydrogenase family)
VFGPDAESSSSSPQPTATAVSASTKTATRTAVRVIGTTIATRTLAAVPTLDPLSAFRLDGKVAIVTGASSGLGARFARVLDAAGARVVVAARRVERLEALAAELHDAAAVGCDLARPDAAESLVADTIERFGAVDVVVNNAGTYEKAPAVDEPLDRFREVIDVNLVAPFVVARTAARQMIESGTGGSIVNISSIWALVGVGQIPEASYAASKGGLVGLTRELAAQWARRGVRVNSLAPGWFPSEMTEGTMFGDERAERWIRNRTPIGRGGEEHELDGALLFLASDASSYVTGQVLCVDGGWTAV